VAPAAGQEALAIVVQRLSPCQQSSPTCTQRNSTQLATSTRWRTFCRSLSEQHSIGAWVAPFPQKPARFSGNESAGSSWILFCSHAVCPGRQFPSL